VTRLVQAREGPGQRLLSLARHLRSPDSGVVGQGVRFLLAGGVVVVVYVTTTIVLADVIGIHFQIALALGFLVAMAVQFTLYRGFVWAHPEYALPMHHQAGRYVTAAAAGYGFSAACTSVLPSALGVPTEAVYVMTVVALPLINFLILRYVIFHAKAQPATVEDPAPAPFPEAD
jgi:putative flippase GtrA